MIYYMVETHELCFTEDEVLNVIIRDYGITEVFKEYSKFLVSQLDGIEILTDLLIANHNKKDYFLDSHYIKEWLMELIITSTEYVWTFETVEDFIDNFLCERYDEVPTSEHIKKFGLYTELKNLAQQITELFWELDL